MVTELWLGLSRYSWHLLQPLSAICVLRVGSGQQDVSCSCPLRVVLESPCFLPSLCPLGWRLEQPCWLQREGSYVLRGWICFASKCNLLLECYRRETYISVLLKALCFLLSPFSLSLSHFRLSCSLFIVQQIIS